MMKLDAQITNLGMIKEASFKLRPITVVAGINGTGKSFVTKTLYSIFNVINRNLYFDDLIQEIDSVKNIISNLPFNLSYASQADYKTFDKFQEHLLRLNLRLIEAYKDMDLGSFFNYTKSVAPKFQEMTNEWEAYLVDLAKKPKKQSSIASLLGLVKEKFSRLLSSLEDGREIYANLIKNALTDEIKENFQVRDLSQLVRHGEKSAIFEVPNLAKIEIKGSEINFNIHDKFVATATSLSSVVFFESPAYWKVREALLSMKSEIANLRFLRNKNQKISSRLTGVPKYFYDLDQTLQLKIKDNYSDEFRTIIANLESELGGEFTFRNGNILFKDHKNNIEIDKNLISFGMTNLGMIHALLKSNVISKGSFLFIDEPEANLHPAWQVLLADTLVRLAENEINVVITTHSSDLLKALETCIQPKKDYAEDFIAIHYTDCDGKLFEFESQNTLEKIGEVITQLNTPYLAQFIKGSLKK